MGGGTYAWRGAADEEEYDGRGAGLGVGLYAGAAPPPDIGGSVPAMVAGCCGAPVVGRLGFSENAVVVSAFVLVIGGRVSPGPLMVEVTPAADPS
jgi:hypothetical protein